MPAFSFSPKIGMDSSVRDFCLTTAWRFPWIRALSYYRPAILVYHRITTRDNGIGLDARTFEKHIVFLQRHFDIVPPTSRRCRRKALGKIQVVLTLDDGFRNQAEMAVPVLRRYRVPALFFVSSRHCAPGQYLWFSYLQALERHFRGNGFYFGGEFINMSANKRRDNMLHLRQTLLNLEPHPTAMYNAIDNELPPLEDFVDSKELSDNFAGMTEEQLGELASDPLFSIGIHTVDHPLLNRCTSVEAYRQIATNKSWIEAISNNSCNRIAYPLGQYNADTLLECRKLGIVEGHALIPLLGTSPSQELPRIGVYSKSLEFLGFKVQWGNWVRSLQAAITTQPIHE